MVLLSQPALLPPTQAVACTGNEIACENQLAGTPNEEWDITGMGSERILGYADEISYERGSTVKFKIDQPETLSNYTIDIYRMGWYQGHGARRITSVTPSAPPKKQDPCYSDSSTGLVDCGNWSVSASWKVPSNAVSGVYFAHIKRNSDGESNHIVFVVRNNASRADIVFQTSDTSWVAYNRYGGNSFYVGEPAGRAYKLSYNRPMTTRSDVPYGQDWVFANEYPMIRWLERNGYDMTYQSGVDTDRFGSLLKNHKIFLSVGHDEYWSGRQRANVEAARDAGVNLGFFSGNEVYWKTRMEPSADGTNTPDRTLVSYKETWSHAKIDPSEEWTGTWRDPRFTPPSDGDQPENALTGTMYQANCCNAPIEVPAADGKMRFWRNTSVANLAAGTKATLADATMGYEYDEAVDNGFQPAGLIKMSTTTQFTPEYLLDHGTKTGDGTATHNITLYRAASGALVFGAGTVQWSWGLDSSHDGPVNPPEDSRMQQATLNLFADMGVQPTTRQSNLVAATKSTDRTPPTSTISAPATNATVTGGTTVTISGSASDVGGRVGGVEVSTDNGATWHPATGRESWTYKWEVSGFGPTVIKVRATDDSANIQTSTTSRTVNVTCPCTGFGNRKPVMAETTDTSSVTLGVKWRSDFDGTVTGVRFYKEPTNQGVHTGSLWTLDGQLLAKGTFTNETAEGWQTLQFATPVPVEANTTYIAAYHAPQGHFTYDRNTFHKEVHSPPLRLLQDGVEGGNGVFALGDTFPNNTNGAANYGVDVILQATYGPDVSPPRASVREPGAGATIAPVSSVVKAQFSENVQPATIVVTLTGPSGAVAGTKSYDAATRTVTFTPSAALANGTTYTASVSGARDLAGNVMAAPLTWQFTTVLAPRPPGVCPCSVFKDTDVPTVPDIGDPGSVELGMRFRADVDGVITGVRFYKAPGNTGTHTGTLWTNDGQMLATVTFVGETASGWQQANFAEPVAVTGGQTYVISYHAPNGHYSANPGQFNANVDNPPLHALADNVDGRNSVYAYGPSTVFPTHSYGASNYWVDVVFEIPPDNTPPGIASSSPGPDMPAAPVTSKVTATFNEAVQAGTPAISVSRPGGGVAGTASYNAADRTLTFTPASNLAHATTYTVTVSGARDAAGNTMSPITWTFTTAPAPRPDGVCPCSVFADDAVPIVADSGEQGSLELGMRFRPTADGTITAVRFYKGAGNTGTHVGNLWDNSGNKLATVTFTGETTTGWQQANFATPVAVSAGQTYVVSYLAPRGHYSYDPAGFATTQARGPLQGLADGADGPNGVYVYGAGGFPTNTYNATNYWVDVVFQPAPDTTAPTVTAGSPPNGSTIADVSTAVHATFSEDVQPASIVVTLTGPGGTVAGTTTYDSATKTATFTPAAPLAPGTAYTVAVSGTRDLAGNAMAPTSWSFTTSTPPPDGSCPCTIFGSSTPEVASADDGSALELGVRFRSDLDGVVTGVRFYKGPGNTGTHVGNLWDNSGNKLATVTFLGELASGWQQALFSEPVPITAGQTYVASYTAPNGHYSTTPGQFATSVDNGPLHALADGVDGGNGTFLYAAGGGFPTGSWNATNYWVDVLFIPTGDTTAPTVTATTPAEDSSSQPLATNTVRATFSEDVQPGTIVTTLARSGSPVAHTTTYDPATRTVTMTLSAPLTAASSYTATVAGARDAAGNEMAPKTWTFRAAGACPCSLFATDAQPSVVSDEDAGSLTIGTSFTPSTNGTVTAIRFYKGPWNTGTHVGALWTDTGTLLASVEFSGESPTGWQTATLPTPVPVNAGTTYVVSYFAPNGRYSADGGYFGQGWTNGPLQGVAGRYLYGGSSAFPENASTANYWVDIVFSPIP